MTKVSTSSSPRACAISVSRDGNRNVAASGDPPDDARGQVRTDIVLLPAAGTRMCTS